MDTSIGPLQRIFVLPIGDTMVGPLAGHVLALACVWFGHQFRVLMPALVLASYTNFLECKFLLK